MHQQHDQLHRPPQPMKNDIKYFCWCTCLPRQAASLVTRDHAAAITPNGVARGGTRLLPFAPEVRFQGEADMNRHARLAGSVKNVEGFGCRPMATMRLAAGLASESLQ